MLDTVKESIAIPASDSYKISGDSEKLRAALLLNTPTPPEKTPPSLIFQRKRDIEIPWQTIFSEIKNGIEESIEPIRIELERSVGQAETPLELIDENSINALKSHYSLVIAAEDDTAKIVYRTSFSSAASASELNVVATAEPIHQGIIFEHGSGRYYLLLSAEGETLTLDDFQTVENYQLAWSKKISGVELVYLSEKEALDGSSDFEELDLRARVIEERFQELLQLRDFQSDLLKKAEPVIDSMIENAAGSGLDLDEIEKIQNKALQMKMASYQIEKRMKRLVGQASDLGYLLFDKDQDAVKFPDKEPTDVKAGYLYRKYKRTAKWTTTETVSRVVRKVLRILFVKVKVKRVVKQQVQRQHAKIVEDYEQVDTSKDLLEEKILELRHQGFQVSVFRDTPQGYLSQDSVSLDSVMEECGRDERVRQETAAILPIYEESMSGERALVKYHIFKKPLPGVQPTAMPRLTLIESLSYRIAWTGTQVGELVSSLNLAPGESRTITMRKEYERETSVTEGRSSVFDLDRQESTDLADEMENQMRSESEHSDETSMSLEVKASYGFVSGAANASHGSKNSLKNFSQGINKIARKSSQSINKKQREEVTSSNTSRVKVSTYDETTAKIENINQGRTLNLMFYRLFNRFKSGLFVEGLKFQALSSVEIIAGSGIQRSGYYSFDSFDELMNEFSDVALPISIPQADKYHYLKTVLIAISELIDTEYRRVEDKAPVNARKTKAKNAQQVIEPWQLITASVLSANFAESLDAAPIMMTTEIDTDASEKLRKLQEQQEKKKSEIDRLKKEHARTQKLYAEYRTKLNAVGTSLKISTLYSDKALEGTEQELLVVAPGLYLDSTLGVQPATEPYSEDMRAQRVRQEAADVALKSAEAQYKLALASSLQNRWHGNKLPENWITGVMPDASSKSLQLRFKNSLEQGQWQLYVDGKLINTSQIQYIGKNTLALTLANAEDCLERDDLMVSVIELRESNDGRLISTVA